MRESKQRDLSGIRTRLPVPPLIAPRSVVVRTFDIHVSRHWELSNIKHTLIVKPITAPPITEASVPPTLIPPLVPGGTGFKVVIRMGFEWDSIPSSEASVSPRQHPKCLPGFLSECFGGTSRPLTLRQQRHRPYSIHQQSLCQLGTSHYGIQELYQLSNQE